MSPEYKPDKRFACPCCGVNYIDIRLERRVRHIEQRAGEKLNITSGYRCMKHNRTVGGSETSSHLRGLAADILTDTSRLRYRIIGAAIRLGFHRIGVGSNFVHLDIDRQKAPRVIWMY